MTFEELQKANEQLNTTPIKGKNYIEVNQRIKAFRMLFPNGCIKTSMLSDDGAKCVFVAEVYDEEGKLLGTGTAFEKADSSFINKTSYIENCETSACGRALAMCGIGIDTSIASAEEVENAINNQTGRNVIDDALNKSKMIKHLEGQGKAYLDNVLNHYGVNSTEDMTPDQINDFLKTIEKRGNK